MRARDAVGGCPESAGPEETHRPAAARSDHGTISGRNGRGNFAVLLARRRFRLQAAGAASFGLIALLLLIVLPARTILVVADGEIAEVTSRTTNHAAVVEQAGIALRPGDWVEPSGDDTLTVHRATHAVLEADGRTVAVRSQAESIDELLAQVDIDVDKQDSVLRNGMFVSPAEPVAAPPPLASLLSATGSTGPGRVDDGPVSLEVRRAVPFMLAKDGRELAVHSSRETVATALRDIGVLLGPGDRVQPPLDTELTAGLEVRVEPATPLIVTQPGGKTILYSLAETVGEALVEGGVDLPPSYRLEPSAAAGVTSGLAIHVVSISEEQELERERIESRTVYRPDRSLAPGARRVVGGHDGVRFRQYAVVTEDGQVVSRELVREWLDPEPADTVVYYSAVTPTPPPAPSQEAPDGLNVVRVLRVYATWYSAASSGRSPSDPAYGITATGVRVDRGIVAVDPSVIPLGTRMFVPGYGNGTAADTGGGISGNMIDLGYPDGVVPDWTSRWVDIYILGP